MTAMTVTFSHIGICVADLERSVRFYRDGLGFEVGPRHHIGNDFARLMELDEVALESQFVHRDGVSIELICYQTPGCHGTTDRRSLTQRGLTHLNLRVSDVDEVAARVETHGGEVHAHTRTTLPGMDFVYCTDPDGVRVELMRLPG
jgi:catechol 2,3-dioxygenase-like lactoylglutathione lyase family enzyme